jgi:UDP-glucuronate 4-epimerase
VTDGARFLVTGAYGCVGAWVVHELVAAGLPVTTLDASADPARLRLLLDEETVAAVPHVVADVADADALERALDEHETTSVIHLAALQVPFCRADPALGARVNVLGTVNVFEAARRRPGRLRHVVYASSVAAHDASTLYGVYKRANEGTAGVYFLEHGVSSVGLRPHTVYGVGRDRGLTSDPTVAMLAAAAGAPYTIGYGGTSRLQLAADVARAFVAAALVEQEGATVHDLPGADADMAEVVAAIERAAPESASLIRHEEAPLPFAAATGAPSLRELVPDLGATPLEEGVRETVERFRELLEAGRVEPPAAAVSPGTR